MAATRSSPPADGGPGGALVHAVDRSLAAHVPRGGRIAVALSGGRDSVALLAAVIACGRVETANVVAVHVHHGLSRHADAWADFCAGIAAHAGIRILTERVRVDRDAPQGIEAAARSARHDALERAARAAGAIAVLLAHHQDDQAETVLLQLMRGAGVHGLAAMPGARTARGLSWLRPLLDVPRHEVESFVRACGLRFVDDDSNAQDRHRRNALRQRVVPALTSVAPGYPATLARSAAHAAEAVRLIDDLASLDAAPLLRGDSLDCAGLAALAPHRASNVFRHFLKLHGLRPPSAARLESMLAQLVRARPDARIQLAHEGVRFGVFRGLVTPHRVAPPGYERDWRGEPFLDLPHGRLAFVATRGAGVAAACVANAKLIVRPRAGGERLQPFAARPRRALKAWLQEASVPSWQRQALPLLFCGDVLVAVPGLGVDVAFQAHAGDPGFVLEWQPAP